jgi:hypothetical protein
MFTCAWPQARLTQPIFFLNVLHRRIIWSSYQLSVRRRPTQCSISVSDRNHTLNSGALSRVYVLEDVSRSYNHQNSLSARETFSIRPSLAWKYSKFVFVIVINTPSQLERYSPPIQFLTEVLELPIGKQFDEDICNLLMCRKVLHMYCFPMHHVSDILSQRVSNTRFSKRFTQLLL